MRTDDRPAIFGLGICRRAQHFWVRHQWVDLASALALLSAWLVIGGLGWVPTLLTEVPSDTRRVAYQVLATVAGTMAGFTLTSVSILVNLLRTPMTAVDRLLPSQDKRRVGDVFLGVLPWLLLLFVGAIIGVVFDTAVAHGYRWLQALMFTSMCAAGSAIARVAWVLRRLLAVSIE
jgi:hypothetical protein